MASSVYKQYTYKCKYHNSFFSGTVAAVNDEDAESEVRHAIGWQKFAFSTGLQILDNNGEEVFAKGNITEFVAASAAALVTRPKTNYPKYTKGTM